MTGVIGRLLMYWRDPESMGTTDPTAPIVVGKYGVVSIEEFPPNAPGDEWSWVVNYDDGSRERYFRAFRGGVGVTSVSYLPSVADPLPSFPRTTDEAEAER